MVFSKLFDFLTPDPVTIQPGSIGEAITQRHDRVRLAIVECIVANAAPLRVALTQDGGDASARLQLLHYVDEPFIPFLNTIVSNIDTEELHLATRAASLAEALRTLDLVLCECLGADGQPRTMDTVQAAVLLGPAFVHIAGTDHQPLARWLGSSVPPKITALEQALQSGDRKRIKEDFYELFLAWKKVEDERIPFCPPYRAWAVKRPFTSLARLACVVAGDVQTYDDALRMNWFVIQQVIDSDDGVTQSELVQLVKEAQMNDYLLKRGKEEHEKFVALGEMPRTSEDTAVSPPMQLRSPDTEKSLPARSATESLPPLDFATILLRAFAVVSALDRKISSAEINVVIEFLQPLGLEESVLRERFIATCKAVHREGVDAAAAAVAENLLQLYVADGARPISRRTLWEAMVRTAGQAGGDEALKHRVLESFKSALERVAKAADLEKQLARYLKDAKADGVLEPTELATILRLAEEYLALNPANAKVQKLVAQCRDRIKR